MSASNGESNAVQESRFEERFIDLLRACRGSKKLLILVVAVALLLDNILVTSVVPIIPSYLLKLRQNSERVLESKSTMSSLDRSPSGDCLDISHDLGHSPVGQSNASKSCFEALLPLKISNIERERDGPRPCIEEKLGPNPGHDPLEDHVQGSEQRAVRHHNLLDENFEVGLMFASKSIMQALTNLFVVGPLTNSIGYSIPMFAGFIIIFSSSLAFALGETFSVLFVARSLQGIGSAFTSVAGMGMLAERYPDDKERGSVMAIALGGLALGVLIGPPFGGLMYELLGKAAPFFMLAFLALLDGMLQLLVLQPKVVRGCHDGASLRTLAGDPCIRVAAGALTVANSAIAVLEPSLPLWMMDTMDASNWEQGAAFLPASLSYLIGTSLFGPLGHRFGRWRVAMIGLLFVGFALFCIPFSKSLDDLIFPSAFIGFGVGMVDSSMMPTLAYLVDIRHTSVYGSVYALGDIAFCASFVLGPLLSATVGPLLGFGGLIIMASLMCLGFAPFLLVLRKPTIMRDEQAFHQATVSYQKYADDI